MYTFRHVYRQIYRCLYISRHQYIYIHVTHMKFRGISGISTDFSYIGQYDLLNTCFGLPQVWYTPGGSMCRICHLTPWIPFSL